MKRIGKNANYYYFVLFQTEVYFPMKKLDKLYGESENLTQATVRVLCDR